MVSRVLSALIFVTGVFSSALHADHISPDEARHLLLWPQRYEFLSDWQQSKQRHSGELIPGLLDAHAEQQNGSRILRLPEEISTLYTQDQINRLWLNQALSFYRDRDLDDADHALSQLTPPVHPLVEQRSWVIRAMVAQARGQHRQALEWYQRVPPESSLNGLIRYNRALSHQALGQSDEASSLLQSLAPAAVGQDTGKSAAKATKLIRYAQLLDTRILAEAQASDTLSQSNEFADSDRSLHRQLLMTEASYYRQRGDRRRALLPLLELVDTRTDGPLSLHQSWLLQYLYEEGASAQAAQISGVWISALMKQLEFQQQASSRVADPDFEKQLNQRHSGDNGSSLVLFSTETRNLIQELERVNSLIKLTEGTLGYAEDYQSLFKKGRTYLAKQIDQHADLAPKLPLPIPEEYAKAPPEELALEAELSRLVGIPEQWQERYKLLNGLALWTTGNPFPYRWWDGKVDYALARAELEKYSQNRLALVEKLLTAVTPERSKALQQLEPRAKKMLKALNRNRIKLSKTLAETLKHEPARMVLKTEQALLWLASKSVPRLQYFSATNKQHYFKLVNNNGRRRLGFEEREPALPDLSKLHSALRLLQEKGLNDSVAFKAQRHLADLTLMLAESAEIEARLPDDPSVSYARAVELLLPLLSRPASAEEHQQILYQLARAYDLNGDPKNSLAMLQRLQTGHPDNPYRLETTFRIAELQFKLNDFDLAAGQYRALLTAADAEEYQDRAYYKLAWSEFKLGNHGKAIEYFFPLVDKYWDERQGEDSGNRRLLADVLRVIAMTFAYQQGVESVQDYFQRVGQRPYEERVYSDLGQYYERKRRYSDAASTFEALVSRYPDSDNAPYYQSRVVAAFSDGGFPIQAWPAREAFVAKFGPQTAYWQQASETRRGYVREFLPEYLMALAQRDHAKAQQANKEKNSKDAEFNYGLAIAWYDQYIASMPGDPKLPEVQFFKAEALTDIGETAMAAAAYEQAAYGEGDFDRRHEAGYAALLAYQQLYEQSTEAADKNRWLQFSIEQSRRFVSTYPNAPQSAEIATKLSEDYLLSDDNAAAHEVAALLLEQNRNLSRELQLRLWRVRAHASFALTNFAGAENAYLQALRLDVDAKERQVFRTRTAEAIYKQGERSRDVDKNNTAAIDHFLRLGHVINDAAVRPNAEFDAATLLLVEKRWPEAINVMEQFRRAYPNNPLQETVPDKLVVAYESTQQWDKASFYLNEIFKREGESALGREALWRSAELARKSGDMIKAAAIYENFIASFPQPLEEAMDAREILLEIADKRQDSRAAERWLNEMVDSVAAAEAVSERSLLLASKASLRLGRARTEAFQRVRLTLPLDKSLTQKQQLMEQAAGYLNQTIAFGLAEPSTFATTMLGDVYRNLSKELMTSERPKELDALALEQYDILLEEQALPFEDQAIEFYELNLKWIAEGIFTPGIATSLDRLREIMPARYDKPERVPSYVEAID